MSGRDDYYKKTHTWPRGLKAKLIRLDGNRCWVCHSTQQPLHIHHYYEFRGGTQNYPYSDENKYNPKHLILLCPSCHGKMHSLNLSWKDDSPLAKAIIIAFNERKENFQNLEDFE